MTYTYIEKLALHYDQYQQQKRYCVAPDNGGDMWSTMQNFDYWLKNFEIKVIPVLQFSSHNFDLFEIQYQLNFYKERLGDNIPFIFFAKRGATIEEMKKAGIAHKIKYIRSQIKNDWIHFFAAGWGKHDCSMLANMGENFSVDTIAYYNTVENMQLQLNDWGHFSENKIDCAKQNVIIANEILKT